MKSQKIDMWFLKYEELYTLEKKISIYKVETLPRIVTRSETKGLLTDKSAHMMGCLKEVHTLRTTMNINQYSNWLILAQRSSKQKHRITTRHGSRNEKADGTRYVDNESIVTDKRK
jgi:carbamoyl-phosphate synthase large subunit